ncbi:hypothetical protein [Rudaeicoccus suwonensis]|uniref:Carbohydrate binding protein n=1 Tax=Rudaeicoccus suwonensis TaxID=657409 RepID=A0A561E351_9MICO|nr:hypothetical protein [Rudaeicoccus suwonensis]TWE10034.1 hypothetical protein BKA23_2382 [Rudaeicoccus suwonensis]
MPQKSTLVSRRKIAKGAAWSVPVVALGAAAPASAASCPTRTCPVVIAFGTPSGTVVSGTGTTATYASATTWGPQAVSGNIANPGDGKSPGFRTTDPLSGNATATWFGVGDEASSASTITVSKTAAVSLVAGCSYTLSLNASTWQGQAQTTLNVTVGTQTIYTLTPTVGTAAAGGSQGLNNASIVTAPFTVPTTTSYTVGINMSLAKATGGSNNDIYVSNLLINCA